MVMLNSLKIYNVSLPVPNLYYNSSYVCLSAFANCRLQFLLDLLGRCLKLSVLAESISCHEFAFQFGLAIFLYAKNI